MVFHGQTATTQHVQAANGRHTQQHQQFFFDTSPELSVNEFMRHLVPPHWQRALNKMCVNWHESNSTRSIRVCTVHTRYNGSQDASWKVIDLL